MKIGIYILFGLTPYLSWSATNTVSEAVILFSGKGETQCGVPGNGNIYAPDMHKFNGKYWMWFGGQGRDGHDRIHLAQSDDGKVWKQLGVVLEDPSANHVNDPSVVRVGKQWFMYYTVAKVDIIDEIALATSADGLRWEKKGTVLSADKAPAFDSLLVGRPSVIRENKKFKMWYDGRENVSLSAPAANVSKVANSQARVGYAESEDGINWTRKKIDSSFQASAVHITRIQNSYVMLFESRDGTKWAVSENGLNWTSQGLLVPSTETVGKFGQVTPFLWWDGKDTEASIYFGAATETTWSQNQMAMATVPIRTIAERLPKQTSKLP